MVSSTMEISDCMTDANRQLDDANRQLQDFVLWALDTLDLRVEDSERGEYVVFAPAHEPDLFHGAGWVRFRFAAPESPGDDFAAGDFLAGDGPPCETVRPDSPMMQWLVQRLRREAPVHSQPAKQPLGLHDVSAGILQPFQVENGKVEIESHDWEEIPILRLTYLHQGALEHHFLTLARIAPHGQLTIGHPANQLLLPEDVARLGLTQLRPAPQAQRSMPFSLSDAVEVAEQYLAEQHSGSKTGSAAGEDHAGEDRASEDYCAGSRGELLATTVVWCPWIAGTLKITIGSDHGLSPFFGWALPFSQQTARPPMFRCPITDQPSYHIGRCSDGTITIAEAIATCQATGTTTLRRNLATCSASGKLVLPDQLAACPISRKPVLPTELVRCKSCRVQASPEQVAGGQCNVCLQLARTDQVGQQDARIACLVDKYPSLGAWHRWRVIQQHDFFLAEARSWTKRLLLVVDTETLEATRVITQGWWSRATVLEGGDAGSFLE